MSSSFARAKQRYHEVGDTCRRQAALILSPDFGVDFYVSGWSARAREAVLDQWVAAYPGTGWNWPEIFRRHGDPDRLEMAIWCGERLSGLGLALTGSDYVEIRFIEGDPRQDCPLKG
jgi:hypothetical protein